MGGQRRQKVLLIVLAVVCLAAVAKFTIFADSGSNTSGPSTTTFTNFTVPIDQSTSSTGGEIPPSPNTFDVFGGKNPFEPAIQVTTPTASSTTASTTPSTGPDGSTTTGNTTPGGSTTTTQAPSNNPSNQLFTLNSINRQSNGTYVATVTIGSAGESGILESETFGPGDTYRFLQATSDNCGDFQHGDVTFNICENSSTLK